MRNIPHPLYSIGNIGYYGSALLTQSYPVLLLGLLFHALQIIFLYVIIRPERKKLDQREYKKDERLYKFFKRDLFGIMNLDLFRGGDLATFILVLYTFITTFMIGPIHSENSSRKYLFYMGQAIFWRMVHTLGIGWILYQQNKTKFWTKYFFKRGYSLQEAFQQWKILFNLTLTMTYATFLVLFYQLYQSSPKYILLNTVGILFVIIHVWITLSVYEELGVKAMFHYDFFLDVKDKQKYSQMGIYKYWRHPMLYTFSCWGGVLISSSWDLFWVTVFGQVCNYIFLLVVEKPHLQQLYGVETISNLGSTEKEKYNSVKDYNLIHQTVADFALLDGSDSDFDEFDPVIIEQNKLFENLNPQSRNEESFQGVETTIIATIQHNVEHQDEFKANSSLESLDSATQSVGETIIKGFEGIVDTAKPHMKAIVEKTKRRVFTLANRY
jgi:phosphatidylethanolamine N-methyltransferase